MKQTHKLRTLGDAAAVVSSAASDTDAARRLGVNRSTIHRWRKAGKIPSAPSGKAPRPPAARPEAPCTAPGASVEPQPIPDSPSTWAAWVRATYAITPTEARLLDLAVAALTIAGDETQTPAVRLAAAARFQSLARHLDLEEVAGGEIETEPDARPWPRRVG